MTSTVDDGSRSPPADGSLSPPATASQSPPSNGSHSPIAEDYHSPIAYDNRSSITDDSRSPITDDLHSTIADDYHSTIADVYWSTKSLNIDDDDGIEEYGDQSNENVREGRIHQNNSDSLQNPVILQEIDDLGFRNNKNDVNSGDTDLITARGKSIPDLVPISANRSKIRYEEHEVIYNIPRGISTLNVNGRPKFELVTVRENGRLQMFMVPNLSPQLVRSPVRDGRLKMWLLNDGHHGGEQPLPPVRRSI